VLGGLLLLLLELATNLFLSAVGFGVMLACLLVIERQVRKLGRAGLETLTGGWQASGGLRGVVGDWRDRFRRDGS
jgi:hypothetical protein